MLTSTTKPTLDAILAAFDATCDELNALSIDTEALVAALREQEEQLRVPTIDLDTAWKIGTTLHDAAAARNLPVAIHIQLGNQVVFHCAVAGAVADNDTWAQRKTAVVARYGQSSARVGYSFILNGEDFDANCRLPLGEYAAHGGAFPLTLCTGVMVGVVAVSGLPSLHDHSLVVAALGSLLSTDDYLND